VGPYCHACGQASPAAMRSLRDALTGQTGRMLYTLRRLLVPGELAREIDRGRDRLAVRPLTLLLNLIPLFFIFGGGTGGFSAHSFIAADVTGSIAAVVAQRGEKQGVPAPLFEERVEQRFKAVYSLLVVVQALAYGAALGVVERRKHKPWLVHFATAIHYMCFSFIVSTCLFGSLRLFNSSVGDHPLIATPLLLLNMAYMATSLHRVYADRWPLAIGKTALLTVMGFVVSLIPHPPRRCWSPFGRRDASGSTRAPADLMNGSPALSSRARATTAARRSGASIARPAASRASRCAARSRKRCSARRDGSSIRCCSSSSGRASSRARSTRRAIAARCAPPLCSSISSRSSSSWVAALAGSAPRASSIATRPVRWSGRPSSWPRRRASTGSCSTSASSSASARPTRCSCR
jgi:hypothetical protein